MRRGLRALAWLGGGLAAFAAAALAAWFGGLGPWGPTQIRHYFFRVDPP